MTAKLWTRLLCAVVLVALILSVTAFITPQTVLAATVFLETMHTGTAAANGDSIAVHEANDRFDNDAFTMSGTGDMRNTSTSSGYTGASGTWNVMLNATGEYFQIADIPTTGYTNLVLSFGIRKGAVAEDGSGLTVAVSSDGISWTALTVPAFPTGTGTTGWYYRTASGIIPATANLRIRFTSSNTTEWRIDDVSLDGDFSGDMAPTVSSTTPTDSATGIAVDANIGVTFSEAVNVAGSWYLIDCASSGTHAAAVSGGPTTFALNPNNNFINGESCTVTLYAAQISDQDSDDPPDTMEADYSWSFTVVEATTGCTELFFSEYVEGSSFNKAVEIYNGSSGVVALDAYTIELYSNGSSTPSNSMTLSGNLAPDAVYVIAHGSASAAILNVTNATNSGVINFNGDDAVVLKHNGAVIDVIGQTGFDPGTEWGSGLTSTADNTLRRKSTISAGDSNGNDAFDPATEWDGYATDTFDGLGTHTSVCSVDMPPAVSSVSPADGATGVVITANIIVEFSEAVDVSSSWFTINCTDSGAHTAAVTGGPDSFTLNPDANFTFGESCTVVLYADQIVDRDGTPDAMISNYQWSFTVSSGSTCNTAATFIHTIQGDGDSSPLAGTSGVAIEGIVVGDFQNTTTELSGFFVQEETADMDGNVNTSEGIFVYDDGFGVDVSVGDVIRVVGRVTEYYGLTQMHYITAIEVCGTGATPSMTDITLPFDSATDLEKYEGMLVTFPQTLYVSGNYQLGRYGEVVLSSGARLDIPTNVVAPGAPAIALQAQNNLNQILLDDDNLSQNVDPIDHPYPGLTAVNTLRSGDAVSNLVGVVSYSWSGYAGTESYRIHPVDAPNFSQSNPRPAVLTSDSRQVRVASFNVLNYFVTFGSRGAENQTEFDRQRAKIISAIVALDADVIGLMEMENHSTDAALQDLVDGLNIATGGTYAYVNTGVLGTDAIKVALIYKPGRVDLIGDPVTNLDTVFSRPPLAQTFDQAGTDVRFTVVVNHFKSKGCGGATGLDADQGDGQSCYNATRVNQANALTAWINTTVIPNTLGANNDPDVLIIGDLNAYAMEDPITAIKGAGYVDMINTFTGAGAYSYVYDNQSGYLDHALASNSLAPWVADVQEWHINADEPIVLDYNTNYKSPDQLTTLYAPDAYRASDHDPVLALLDFNIYVDDDYTASTSGWGINRFSAIQSGIDASAVGTTVYVENLTAGGEETYAESVVLNKNIGLIVRDPIRLAGSLTIQNGIVTAPSGSLTLGGNFAHSGGTFNHNNGTVILDGGGTPSYTGSGTTFHNLAVNTGTVLDIGDGFAVAGAVSNNGGLRQTQSVNVPLTPVAFLNISTDKYYGVVITPMADMGATTVTVYGNQACANATSPTVLRCYDISPATQAAADITFYYLNTEANGQVAPNIWHWSGTDWERETLGERGTMGNAYAWIQATSIDSYSDFTAGDAPPSPTAITLASLTATPQDAAILVVWETASELDNVGFNLYRSETADGPYTRLNATLILPQHPGSVLGAFYEWLDVDVQPNAVYYYKLEDLDVKGVSTFYGPISTAVVTAPTAVGLQSVAARGTPPSLTLGLLIGLGLVIVYRRRRSRST